MSYRSKIALTLGLITTLVNIDTATEAEESFRTVCVGDDPAKPHPPTGVRQSLACPTCLNSDRGSFKQARQDGDEFTIVTAEEIADARGDLDAMKKQVALTVHEAGEVRAHTMPAKASYYLTPSSDGMKETYALFVDTLKRHPEVCMLGLWVPVKRANLYEVKLFGDTLVMEERARTEAIKVVQQPASEPNPMFVTQMDMLLPAMLKPYDPADYEDSYAKRLAEVIAAKQATPGIAASSKGKAAPTPVVDLTSVLDQMMASTGRKSA